MAERPVPEAWIGENVAVLVGEALEPLGGPLLEVNDRGVVINMLSNLEELEERHESGQPTVTLREEMKFVDMLIPWQRISGVSKSSVDKS
jgi:hypothetical protein